jgi:hypothetical protein
MERGNSAAGRNTRGAYGVKLSEIIEPPAKVTGKRILELGP